MYLTRHGDMIRDVNMQAPIVIVGAGSIGSYATLALAKLGFNNLMVFDDGIVEEENIAPQWYRPRDIGVKKVDALKKAIKDQTGVEILTVDARLNRATMNMLELLHGADTTNLTVVVAVDSMSARKWIAETVTFENLIDARMAIEFLAVYSVNRKEELTYIKTIHTDENSVQEACTNKAISYTSLLAGGLVAKCVLDRLKGTAPHFQVINFDINSYDFMRL